MTNAKLHETVSVWFGLVFPNEVYKRKQKLLFICFMLDWYPIAAAKTTPKRESYNRNLMLHSLRTFVMLE